MYDLLGISGLEQEEYDDTYEGRGIQSLLRYVRAYQAKALAQESAVGGRRPEAGQLNESESHMLNFVEEQF